jgi:iron complex outermembrane receptor protein
MAKLLALSPVIAGIFVFSAGHVLAQQAQPNAKLAGAPPPAPDSNEIVVTAQRRSERAIDVPQTVNMVTSDKLQKSGVTDTLELAQVVPNLYIAPNGLTVQPTIRGVGSSITTPGASGTVAAYIDGVYQLAQGSYNFDFADVDNVQVLKGPQGTLYGRDATGGVILITTTPPSFTPGGKVSFGYGNYNSKTADIYLTGGILPNLAGNLSIDYNGDDGYFYDIYRHKRLGGVDDWSARGKLLYKFGNGGQVVFTFAHSDDSDPNSFESAPLNGDTLARLVPGTLIPTKPFDVALNFDPYIKNIYNQASVSIDFGNDLVHVSSISGANFNTEKISTDADFSPLPTTTAFQVVDEKVLSQEVTLSSAAQGKFSWIGGLMYVRTEGQYNPYISVATNVVRTDTTNDSYSGFFEGTYRITDRLKLIAGARYTVEDLAYTGSSNGVAKAQATLETKKWTPRVSLNYEVTENTNVYATYSEGFRSGGWNASILSNTPYQPETVTAYEIGAKSSFWHRLNVSAAIFDYDFSNIQFSAATVSPTGVSSTTIINAAAATLYGAELSGDLRLTPALSLQGGFGYTHGRYDSFPNAIVTAPTGRGG